MALTYIMFYFILCNNRLKHDGHVIRTKLYMRIPTFDNEPKIIITNNAFFSRSEVGNSIMIK